MAVFTWPCDPANVQESIHYRTLITEFESGKEQRRSKGTPRRRWSLKFRKDQVDADAIWSFYVARKGAYQAFTWTNPVDGVTHRVRFADDNLTRQVFWRLCYEYGITFLEVIESG